MKQPEVANNQLVGAGKSRREWGLGRQNRVGAKPTPEHRRLAAKVERPETSIH
ncbi:hypothetical protein E2C01_101819 [Portunus trituberculatus]|uniref:Uncharacterized protein n=1 Tax=Portunus trituberculatus TaxID=210409 RepID=A0A5B7KFS8_PORTR|nr:hypothetical protein [Portunus trituberculatus]